MWEESDDVADLQKPKKHHYFDVEARDTTRANDRNTVGSREAISIDINKIKNGEAYITLSDKNTGKATEFTLENGHIYGVGKAGKLFPKQGSGDRKSVV